MERLEIAKEYFNTNTKPLQDLCPELIQYWTVKAGKVWWSNKTGKRTYVDPKVAWHDGDRTSMTPRNFYDGFYVRYIDEIEAVEFASIGLEVGGRGKDGVKVDWLYCGSRYLCFKGDTGAYYHYGTTTYESGSKYYHKGVVSFINYCHSYLTKESAIRSELERCLSGLSLPYVSPYWVSEWYKSSWMPRSQSKRAKQIEDYVLEEPSLSDKEIIKLYVQILDDNFAVLRLFNSQNVEDNRIFVDAKGKPTLYAKRYGKWVQTPATSVTWYYSRKNVDVYNYGLLEEWKPLKYIYKLIDWNATSGLNELLQILRHPIIEQLAKAGYPQIAKDLMVGGTVQANMKQYFFTEKEKKLPMYKLLGCNKFLLEEVERIKDQNGWRTNNRMRVVYSIKKLYDSFDVSDLDKDTISMLVRNVQRLDYRNIEDLCRRDNAYGWRWREQMHISEDDRKFILRLFRMNDKEQHVSMIQLFLDTIGTYHNMINPPDIDLHDFEDVTGLQRIHDSLVELKLIQDLDRQAQYDERRRKEREEQQKKFEKLQTERISTYEADGDQFCIRVPKSLDEITQEGSALHHCVGGYLQSHAVGNTNIIFLRRKEDESKPFYTIEVSNGSVVQIHGSHNRWLGNDPEAIPFVYQWLTERGIKFKKEHLLNKGAGYGASRENLPESYLYSA